MLNQPSFIPKTISEAKLNFLWSSSLGLSLYDSHEPSKIKPPKEIYDISPTAQTAISLAILEWITFTLASKIDVSEALQRIEAAWAGLVKKSYCADLDFDVDRIVDGPEIPTPGYFEGPLQAVMIKIQDVSYNYQEDIPQMTLEFTKSLSVGLHVIPKQFGFETWVNETLVDLKKQFPTKIPKGKYFEIYPYEKDPMILRSWFETKEIGVNDKANFLKTLDSKKNPFLELPMNH